MHVWQAERSHVRHWAPNKEIQLILQLSGDIKVYPGIHTWQLLLSMQVWQVEAHIGVGVGVDISHCLRL